MSDLPSHYSRYLFSERPTENLTPTTFKREICPFDLKPNDTQVLVKVTWLSLDPAMRIWLNDANRAYMAPVKLGQVMRALGLGVVVEAGPNSRFTVGDEVSGGFGWTEFAVMNDKDVTKLIVPPGGQVLDHLGALGPTGLTAFFGLFDVGHLKEGETLVVSGASGAVGSIACQLGKLKGAQVIAIAGGPEKCKWLKDDIGVDASLDYKSPTFYEDLKKSSFADVYFDNVGGGILNLMLTRLKMRGRVVLCGAISDYNSKPTGLTAYMSLIAQRARLEGFIVTDYVAQYPAAIEELSRWLANGSIKQKFHIVHGLDAAPEALPMLYTGGNTGKLVVKVAKEELSKL